MALEVRPHPLRVRPLGSRLFDSDSSEGGVNLRDISLGALRTLPDEVVLRILGTLPAPALGVCACVSRAMRVLAYTDELWKACLLEELPSSTWLRWHKRGWRQSYLLCRVSSVPDLEEAVDIDDVESGDPRDGSSLASVYYYSDVLYAPWQCGTAAIPRSWSRAECIPRVAANGLSVAEFASRFEAAGRPVILTGLASAWPAASEWSFERLRARFANTVGFHIGGYTMGLADFFDYCATTTDETPLYLFDKRFGAKRGVARPDAPRSDLRQKDGQTALEADSGSAADSAAAADGGSAAAALVDEYTVPEYFAPERDLFASLPAEYRPDHRWLIIGGKRSGSSWHVDPNATSAWNACVVGKKKWILTPPGQPPPGVTASEDGVSVTAPISLYEWFRVFYSSLAELRSTATAASAPLEATVSAGEILFVPAGWWHCCLNLEPSIAITQNYAPASQARAVLQYLRAGGKCGELVSGLPDELRPLLHERFAEVLERLHPEALREVDVDAVSRAAAQAPSVAAPNTASAAAPVEFRFSFA